MSTKFSQSFKIQAVEKALNRPEAMGLRELSLSLGVGTSTLHTWITRAKKHELTTRTSHPFMPPEEKRPQDWSLPDRLQAIIETSPLQGEALSAYCRQKGIYLHHLAQWKQHFLQTESGVKTNAEKAEMKALQIENKQLKKDLTRKEKALAEAAALLILQKKVNRMWYPNEDV